MNIAALLIAVSTWCGQPYPHSSSQAMSLPTYECRQYLLECLDKNWKSSLDCFQMQLKTDNKFETR